MCWVCRRLEVLVAGWNEESEFQEQTGTDYHRGMSRGFHECARDLSEAVASLRLKGVCDAFPEHAGTLSEQERQDILDGLLGPSEEDGSPE